MRRELPFISVVIVTYNGLEVLRKCIASLLRLNYPKNRHEIIIVDNNSTDNTVEFLRKKNPGIRIIQNPSNMGYVGMNSAISKCRGDYIYFTNNDLTVSRNTLSRLVSVMEKDRSIGFAAQTIINYFDRKLVSGGTWISRAMYSGHIQKREHFDVIEIPYMGAGMIRKSLALKFGCIFDQDYFIYGEDVDLGLRLRLIGMRSVQVYGAFNNHMHSMTTKKYQKGQTSTFLMERNNLVTFFKIFSWPTILRLLPYLALVRIILLLKDFATFKFGSAWMRLNAYFWILANFGKIMKKRRALQKLRSADDSYILKVFSERFLLRKKFLV